MASPWLLRAQVTLGMDSAIQRDAANNVWWFRATGAGLTTQVDDIFDALEIFYQAVDVYLSKDIDPANVRCRIYNMQDAEPRAPIKDAYFTGITPDTGNTTIHEITCAVTYQAPRLSGVDQRSRRGRVYLGPLGATTITAGGMLSSSVADVFAAAAEDLRDASALASDWEWVVYSRVLDSNVAVTDGWVDNAPDIQRRRGVDYSYRSLWG